MSWLGRGSRYESRNVFRLDRRYEFNIRGFVCVGSEDFVVEKREPALPAIRELAESLDLDMTVKSATDPVFATVSAGKKVFQQARNVTSAILLHALKAAAQPKLLEGGSVNLQGTLFGEQFDNRTESRQWAHANASGVALNAGSQWHSSNIHSIRRIGIFR